MNRVTGRLSRYLHIQVLSLLGSSPAPCATGIITLLMSTSPAVSLLIYIATGSASLGLVAANDRFWRKAAAHGHVRFDGAGSTGVRKWR
jgi:Na+/H+-dicarboxylate symporter